MSSVTFQPVCLEANELKNKLPILKQGPLSLLAKKGKNKMGKKRTLNSSLVVGILVNIIWLY